MTNNVRKIDELLAAKPGKVKRRRTSLYLTLETYDAFKLACEARGLVVGQVMDALMEDFVREHGGAGDEG